MKRETFLELLGSISDAHVAEFADMKKAGKKKKGTRRWVRRGMLAACLALALTAASLTLPDILRNSVTDSGSEGAGSSVGVIPVNPDGSGAGTGDPGENGSGNTGSGEGAQGPGGTNTSAENGLLTGKRPMLINVSEEEVELYAVTPHVAAYTVEPGLGNIDNLEKFYLGDDEAAQLAENGFLVYNGQGGREFFELYEISRYAQIPNFVTVDSLMHTYHLYFSYLLKNIERQYLADCVTQLSHRMLDNSLSQYERLKGSEWENAARRNAAFFTVGAKLLDESTAVDSSVEDMVQYELDCIGKAERICQSEITGAEEDYTQYIPRGYYEGDERLERYFKAMMWYGRIHFTQEKEDLDRSALLITLALSDDPEAYRLWEAAYVVTAFFAGASDDLGVCEYASVMREAYGDNVSVEALAGDKEAFERFHALTAKLSVPELNSIPIRIGEDNVIPGLRFMGQRFTIDAAIMQNLIYSRVEENREGARRMLPDVLDVAAALGSDAALEILEEKGDTEYAGYSGNMARLREGLSKENATLWSASLYAGWLNTLRPLLDVKGEGYPMFMQNDQWTKKNLESFAGSFTELKHDTVLYSKQVIAEMGGEYDENADYRGYVEPEPLIYCRFAILAEQTAKGLESYGILTSSQKEDLLRLAQMAEMLYIISNKELADEVLTEDEYDFIEYYGGTIEHFWYETVKDEPTQEGVSSGEFPAALVVDIATDPSGLVLEAATGNPSMIYVIVKVDGSLRIARGCVYSFYQFTWPASDRLTDSKWRLMMGLQADENGYYHYDKPVEKPDWTRSYSYGE